MKSLWKTFLLTAVFGACLSEVFGQSRAVSQSLYMTNPYDGDIGDRGDVDVCNDNSYVSGIRIKYVESALDEVAITGIQLSCAEADNHDVGWVSSTIGGKGEWYGPVTCNSGEYVEQFKAQVLAKNAGDNVAVQNITMKCSDRQEIVFDLDVWPICDNCKKSEKSMRNIKDGVWGEYVSCDSGKGVCGIQTAHDQGLLALDEAAITDVTLFCCNLPSGANN